MNSDHEEIRARLPRFIRAGTDGPQPDAVYFPRLLAVMKQADYDPSAVRQVLDELIKEDVVVQEQRDDETYPRFRLPKK